MIDAVKRGDINKVTKFTSSGLDPNFNDHDTGGWLTSILTSLKFNFLT